MRLNLYPIDDSKVKGWGEGVRKMAFPAWFLIRVYTSHPCSARRRGFSQAESPHSRTLSPPCSKLIARHFLKTPSVRFPLLRKGNRCLVPPARGGNL
jgi:hypothetical protein